MGHNGAISSYSVSMGIPRVDGKSTDPRILGRHSLVSEHRYTIYLRLDGHGSRPLHFICILCYVLNLLHVMCSTWYMLCTTFCVNYIHGKMYREKRNIRVRKPKVCLEKKG